MAMDASRLANAIVSAVQGVDPPPRDAGTDFLRAYWLAIAGCIISEISGNAIVTTSTPNVQSGATTKPGTGTVA